MEDLSSTRWLGDEAIQCSVHRPTVLHAPEIVMHKHDVTLLIMRTGLRLSVGDVNRALQRSSAGVMCRNRQVNSTVPTLSARKVQHSQAETRGSVETRRSGVLHGSADAAGSSIRA